MRARAARIALAILTAAGMLSALNAVAQEQPWRQRPVVGREAVESDIQQEILFGREVAARLIARYRYYDNDAVMRYVNLVGKTLAQSAGRPEIEFHFAVVETSDINAYAAPGGYVFVTKGALEAMQDESELACVLAHEIVHITGKHIVKELNIHGTEDSAIAGFARLIGGTSESARLAFSQAVDKAMDKLFKDGYKREDEAEADQHSVILSSAAGYDPSALVRYLARIAPLKGKETAVLDKTHPPFDARIAMLKETIANEGIAVSGADPRKGRFTAAMKNLK